jgi:hypothetical protein
LLLVILVLAVAALILRWLVQRAWKTLYTSFERMHDELRLIENELREFGITKFYVTLNSATEQCSMTHACLMLRTAIQKGLVTKSDKGSKKVIQVPGEVLGSPLIKTLVVEQQ